MRIALALGLVAVLLLAACGGSDPAAPDMPQVGQPVVEQPVVEQPAQAEPAAQSQVEEEVDELIISESDDVDLGELY